MSKESILKNQVLHSFQTLNPFVCVLCKPPSVCERKLSTFLRIRLGELEYAWLPNQRVYTSEGILFPHCYGERDILLWLWRKILIVLCSLSLLFSCKSKRRMLQRLSERRLKSIMIICYTIIMRPLLMAHFLS